MSEIANRAATPLSRMPPRPGMLLAFLASARNRSRTWSELKQFGLDRAKTMNAIGQLVSPGPYRVMVYGAGVRLIGGDAK